MRNPTQRPKASFGGLIPKCRTDSNLGNIGLFNAGLKIGEPQLLDDWSLAATTTQTQNSCRAEATRLHSLALTDIASGWTDAAAMVVRTDACPESSRLHWRTEIARHPLGAGEAHR